MVRAAVARRCRFAGLAETASTATARRSCKGCEPWANGTCWIRRPTPACGPRNRHVVRGGRGLVGPTAETSACDREAGDRGEATATLPASAWKRLTVAEGSQGSRVYEYAEMTVWFSEEGCPAEAAERLLVRRSLDQEAEIKYQRSNAPPSVPLTKLATVGGSRWTIEQDFQAAKGECGLDEYETRGWTGWHHHTALSMLALFFLEVQRQRLGEKRTTDDRPRSARRAATPAGRSPMGRKGNHHLVTVAAGTQSNCQRLPSSPSSKAPK